eukprot:scaffold127403_cov64-Cyclotella_meneghiniana.AAC.1
MVELKEDGELAECRETKCYLPSALFCFVGKKTSLGWRGSQGSSFTFQNVMKISRTQNLFGL